jgi:ABC-type sugar transport system ATPase subunit
MLLVEAKNINISFSGIQILFDVEFELRAGEIHCLCGENGAGKSTLVKILTGIYDNYTGSINLEDMPVVMDNPITARRYGVYAVQQHRDLVPSLNAVENIFMGNEIYKTSKGKQRFDFAKMKKISLELIDKFGITINVDVPVEELKVSEQGVIAICKALATESKILLIDEASAPLDSSERQVLFSTLKKLRDEGKGIVYITHHLDEVFNIGDRITVLRNGQNVATVDIDEYDRDKLIAAMTGDAKMYDREYHERPDDMGEPIMEFRNVYSDHLRNLSFKVYKGEVVGFAGLEGSFKDEIAEIAFGLKKYHQGVVLHEGKPVKFRYPIQAIRKGVGLVPTDRKNAGLVTCRSVLENMIMASINKYKTAVVSSRWARKVVNQSINDISLKTSGPDQLVEYLSGGNQQKVLLAKWLEAQSEILYLVEPTEGIDVGARADLYRIFKELIKQGKALVIFTSDIDELMALSDRIFTIVEGDVVNEYDIKDANKIQILSDILSKHKACEEVV